MNHHNKLIQFLPENEADDEFNDGDGAILDDDGDKLIPFSTENEAHAEFDDDGLLVFQI
jgi:hypothetical protein